MCKWLLLLAAAPMFAQSNSVQWCDQGSPRKCVTVRVPPAVPVSRTCILGTTDCSLLTPNAFGADPTGAADSTAAMQALANATKQFWMPCGATYKVTGTVTITPYHQIFGCPTANVTATSAMNIANLPVFDIGAIGGFANVNWEIAGFTINAANAIRRGDPDWTDGQYNSDPLSLGGSIHDMVFLGSGGQLAGCPSSCTNPNVGTGTIETLATLRGYGACLSLTHAYKLAVTHNFFQSCGIGILVVGSDQMEVYDNRFNVVGRTMHIKWFSATSGYSRGRGFVKHNDMGVVILNPSIYLDDADGWVFAENFFEAAAAGAYGPTPWAADTFIHTTGDAETFVHHNHFGINPVTATPVLSFGGYQNARVEDNNFAANGAPAIEVIPPTLYNGSFPILGTFKRNTGITTPKLPGILDDTADNMHLSFNSIPDPTNNGGLGGPMFNCVGTCNSWPWTFDSVANGYVIGSAYVQSKIGYVRFPLQNQTARRWLLRITGRATAGGGFIQFDGHYLAAVTNIDHTVLPYNNCQINPTIGLSTTQLQSCESWINAPAGESGNNVVLIHLNPVNAIVASVELIPQPEHQAAVRVYTNGTIPVDGTFEIGDLVLNSTAAAGGTPAWLCTTAGTFNPIGTTTHGTSTGTTTFDIDAVGVQDHYLAEGQYITIAGVTGTRKIISQIGLHVTVDSALGATFTSALVSHSIGTFSALNSFPAPPNGAAGGDLTGTYPNPTLGTAGTAGTYSKVTTDAKGRVTSGTTIGAADLPALAGGTVALTGQTASIGSTNISFNGGTPPAGSYLATMYLRNTVAGSAGTVTVTLTYNDGSSSHSFSDIVNLNNASGAISSVDNLTTNGGAVSYSTTVTGATGSPQYALEITLTRTR